jgi:hypothetical protein
MGQQVRLSASTYTGDNLHFTIPTFGVKSFYVVVSLYIHNMLFGLNLVAIATILKAKFAAKILLFFDVCKR